MHNLLNAGFSRLKKNKIFLVLLIITVICAAFFLFGRYYDGLKYNGYGFPLKTTDQLLIDFINLIGFFIALFISLFVGAEYSDGTIRNKIIIGHSRKNIYLSNLIISITVGIIIELVYLLVIAIIGIPMFGGLQMPLSEFCFILLDILMIIVSFSSIFNFISLICSNITISTVICILLTLVMLIAAPYYKILLDVLPSGQAIQLSAETYRMNANIEILSLYSLVLATIINSTGIYLFNKKDLK